MAADSQTVPVICTCHVVDGPFLKGTEILPTLRLPPEWFLLSKAIDFLQSDGGHSHAKHGHFAILSGWVLLEISMGPEPSIQSSHMHSTTIYGTPSARRGARIQQLLPLPS